MMRGIEVINSSIIDCEYHTAELFVIRKGRPPVKIDSAAVLNEESAAAWGKSKWEKRVSEIGKQECERLGWIDAEIRFYP